MSYEAESEPLETFRQLIDDEWVGYPEVPKPQILIMNDPDDSISRVNLNDGDALIISYGGTEQVRPRGNMTYEDHVVPILFTMMTKENRQRLRDIYKEVRGICSINKHLFTNWQLIKPVSYTEEINVDLNWWRGRFLVELNNHAVTTISSL